ncbi:MAG: LexA family transcriptional regulator [Mesorhizobium sp.]|uniref:XRE family transcriptional regulator n=1 Tax=Mesorhizobium sp. M7A.F.Ca.ET.027.02.1.1 TaxID=2496655 RepID=UPI000FD3E3B7|nr:XRE family transcriptional regulator [Mesorhizobium sp. M7A.F.Ca.ET.027.02.1.1]RVD14247.1 LexA family transcriptional regulator [Mesorhizobium sp. M7A.F.Ca.ET.027.02.1.1]RWD08211.1 MAG: LexA family transcriptional regulator [Mesorhizobium sp.]
MNFDDRPEFAKRLEQARIARGFATAKDAAKYFGWSYDTYAQHENGTRGIGRASEKYAKAYRVGEGWLLTGEGDGPGSAKSVAVMGYLGAGAEVEPDYEQVPPEGLEQIEIPFPLPDDMIAFKVRGESMMPVFKHDAVIIVYREQKKPLESFYGEEAAVRTTDGRRFLKTITRGQGGVTLTSWNALPIENVTLEWIGELFAVLPPSSLKKVGKQGGIQGQLRLKTA